MSLDISQKVAPATRRCSRAKRSITQSHFLHGTSNPSRLMMFSPMYADVPRKQSTGTCSCRVYKRDRHLFRLTQCLPGAGGDTQRNATRIIPKKGHGQQLQLLLQKLGALPPTTLSKSGRSMLILKQGFGHGRRSPTKDGSFLEKEHKYAYSYANCFWPHQLCT